MVLTKIWLNEKLNNALEKQRMHESNNETTEGLLEQGKSIAFTEVLTKLTEPPQQKIKSDEMIDFDPDKTFEYIARYYVDKKGYTVEHANDIAMKIVSQQKQQRLQT